MALAKRQNNTSIDWIKTILNSYAQVFFSLNKVLAFILLFITFFKPQVGFSGLLTVVTVNMLAWLSGTNRSQIEEGIYGFNALLFGLYLGNQYEWSFYFIALLLVCSALLLIISVWLSGLLSAKQLPFLSFPFILTYWITSLSVNSFSNISVREDNLFVLNQQLIQENSLWYTFTHIADHLPVPEIILVFFKTLSGTFFQSSVLAGILIAAAILYVSRISFTLSLLGFLVAYFFFSLFGADVHELNQNLAGSNFIFMAIAVGCFYLIPNGYSYLTVVLLIPILLFLLLFFQKLMYTFHLKSYTFSFSVVVILFILFLKNRWLHKYLHLVSLQYYQAEKTVYKHAIYAQRIKYANYARFQLPFWGEWYVSQGYQGKITHLGDWSQALDFVITDEKNKTYALPGVTKEDYYCYNKPVTAPLEGYVYQIINHVDDNGIAEVNTQQNWGNSIIINHLNGLFTQISHIKKDSFKVNTGDYVFKGQVLATCGNSGRSPEPHIHFQLQSVPVLGAKTLSYPFACYIERKGETLNLKSFEIPQEGSLISNVEINSRLLQAYQFTPGKKVVVTEQSVSDLMNWEIFTDSFNRTYFYCHKTDSTAWFVQNGTEFYFYDFEGDTESALFYFYLASYHLVMGTYLSLELKDTIPLVHFSRPVLLWLQDFISPFYRFIKASYTSVCVSGQELDISDTIKLKSSVKSDVMGRVIRQMEFDILIEGQSIRRFTVRENNQSRTFLCAY